MCRLENWLQPNSKAIKLYANFKPRYISAVRFLPTSTLVTSSHSKPSYILHWSSHQLCCYTQNLRLIPQCKRSLWPCSFLAKPVTPIEKDLTLFLAWTLRDKGSIQNEIENWAKSKSKTLCQLSCFQLPHVTSEGLCKLLKLQELQLLNLKCCNRKLANAVKMVQTYLSHQFSENKTSRSSCNNYYSTS